MAQSMSPDTCSRTLPLAELTVNDIPGADLDEPLRNHTMAATIMMMAPDSKLF